MSSNGKPDAGGLPDADLMVDLALRAGGVETDFTDVFAEEVETLRIVLHQGRVVELHGDRRCGVGVRSVRGALAGFAHTADLSLSSLRSIAREVRKVAPGGRSRVSTAEREPGPRAAALRPMRERQGAGSIHRALEAADVGARTTDGRIRSVTVALTRTVQRVRVADSDQHVGSDRRVRTLLHVQTEAVDGGKRQGGVARMAAGAVLTTDEASQVGRRAGIQAIRLLDAGPAPRGPMPVLVASGWGAVLLHEAIGHGIELDFVRKGTSSFADRLGDRVACAEVTIHDSGHLRGQWGSSRIDDEGQATRRTLLVDRGVLVAFMADRHNALLTGGETTANGRRESYRHAPLPRMTNMCLDAGPHAVSAMLAAMGTGFYARDLAGGQVDISSGSFVFQVSEGYRVDRGQIGQAVAGATLVGSGADVLGRISMVGDDFALSPGTCGKDGQSIFVGSGQPHVLVDQLTVSGDR